MKWWDRLTGRDYPPSELERHLNREKDSAKEQVIQRSIAALERAGVGYEVLRRLESLQAQIDIIQEEGYGRPDRR